MRSDKICIMIDIFTPKNSLMAADYGRRAEYAIGCLLTSIPQVFRLGRECFGRWRLEVLLKDGEMGVKREF